MKSITEVIDSKFEKALHMSLSGMDSIHTSSPLVGSAFELIALDSYEAPESRCVLARNCIGTMPVSICGIDIVTWGVEIPREENDNRRFEELAPDDIEGFLFKIGVRSNESIIIEGPINADWLSVAGLSYALSGMRVTESNPLVF